MWSWRLIRLRNRMGVRCAMRGGKMVLLTQSDRCLIFAYYRISRLVARGVVTRSGVNEANRARGRADQDLRHDRIAEDDRDKFGCGLYRYADRLKYIGDKMYEYEKALAMPITNSALPPNAVLALLEKMPLCDPLRVREVTATSRPAIMCATTIGQGKRRRADVRRGRRVGQIARARALVLDYLDANRIVSAASSWRSWGR